MTALAPPSTPRKIARDEHHDWRDEQDSAHQIPGDLSFVRGCVYGFRRAHGFPSSWRAIRATYS